MSGKPILFSGPMVKAILDGRKTVTRRVLKYRKDWVAHELTADDLDPSGLWNAGGTQWQWGDDKLSQNYQVGQRLWVRETFRETWDVCDTPVMEYRAGGSRLIVNKTIQHGQHRCCSMLAPWRPSIFMPRWASRINLEIVSVSVERLQEIAPTDVLREGIPLPEPRAGHDIDIDGFYDNGFLFRAWEEGWNKINGKRKGCDWQSNPWVWVIEFKRV